MNFENALRSIEDLKNLVETLPITTATKKNINKINENLKKRSREICKAFGDIESEENKLKKSIAFAYAIGERLKD